MNESPRVQTPAMRLEMGQVHIWFAYTRHWMQPEYAAYHRGLLSAEELSRMNAFRFDHLRNQFLATRVICRTALSSYAEVAPGAWQFRANEFGRPELSEVHAVYGLRFSLSNVSNMVVCAITRGDDIGVDVESILRENADVALADRYFAPSESADIRSTPPEYRVQRFFRYWTLKEAYIKARGLGLSLPLDAFAMRLSDPSIEIKFDHRVQDVAGDWQFDQEWIDTEHLLAVAVRRMSSRSSPEIELFEFTPGALALSPRSWVGRCGDKADSRYRMSDP